MPVRKNIRGLTPYEPGKPIKELKRELGIDESDIIKLASNENPIGPSPKAVKAMRKAFTDVNRYPDGSSFYLKQRLAYKLKVKPENIVLGNGSDELIDIITKTFLEENEEAIISKPSFLEYEIITKTRGASVKAVALDKPAPKGSSLRTFSYNIDNIIKAINKRTKLMFLGNPDNPTGAYMSRDELSYFLKKCPKRVIVVFDEAYRELVSSFDYSNPAGYINRGNIIVLRTFSKAYGLAGLRVGYAITSRALAGWMERVRQPFNVNLLAQVAAEAALSDTAHLLKTKRLIKKERMSIIRELLFLGADVIASPANFILFSFKGADGTEIFKKLLKYGIIIRDMKAYGLNKWVRVNVGTIPENRRFIKTLKRIKSTFAVGKS
ncbi:MAG: histidinol-phosphate transaminase [Candidatus Omnitrophota bacterium]